MNIKDIDKQELLKWLGSDITKDGLLDLLLDLVNGSYEQHEFFNDVRQYSKDN